MNNGRTLYQAIASARAAGFRFTAGGGGDLSRWQAELCQSGAADWCYSFDGSKARIIGPEEVAIWPDRFGVFKNFRRAWRLAR